METTRLLERHEELYGQLLDRAKQLGDVFPLDDEEYSKLHLKFVKIGKLLKLYR